MGVLPEDTSELGKVVETTKQAVDDAMIDGLGIEPDRTRTSLRRQTSQSTIGMTK